MKLHRSAAILGLLLFATTASFYTLARAMLPVPIGTKLDITLNTPLSTQFSQAR
ncbi:MAG: hypothetical protein WA655_07870 [Candidatus Korobacteraceae bacterium]